MKTDLKNKTVTINETNKPKELTTEQKDFLISYEWQQLNSIAKMKLSKSQKKKFLAKLWNELRRIKLEMLNDAKSE